MTVPLCTCMQYAPGEHLAMWRRRAEPTIRRLILRGHYKPKEVTKTVLLVMLVERAHPDTLSRENWNRSHHLPKCPCNPRNTPLGKIDTVSLEAG